MILALLNNDGLEPRKVAMTNGGEYSSPCPACGGRDRFRSWTEHGRYWCRQCGKSGDAIQYLRDFHGLSFKDAANRMGKVTSIPARVTPRKLPAAEWSAMAGKLVEYAHENLVKDEVNLAWLKGERGLGIDAVKRHRLGWVHRNIFDSRSRWGMDEQLNDKGNPKKVLIPSGLVIPCGVHRVRIRWDNSGDYGKYYVLPGSSSIPMVIKGHRMDPAIIVESELDAILLSQEIHNPFTIIALGSAQIKPDDELAESLSRVPFILVALDSDEAGAKQAVGYWLQTYENAIITQIPTQFGKDPSEAHLNGLDLNLWLSAAYSLVIDMAD